MSAPQPSSSAPPLIQNCFAPLGSKPPEPLSNQTEEIQRLYAQNLPTIASLGFYFADEVIRIEKNLCTVGGYLSRFERLAKNILKSAPQAQQEETKARLKVLLLQSKTHFDRLVGLANFSIQELEDTKKPS